MMMKKASPSIRQIVTFTVILAFLVLIPIQTVRSQGSSSTAVSIVPEINTAIAGETLTVNITINNVQNLYGIDVTLNWNNSILQIVRNESRIGVETNLGGVLHNPLSIVEDSAFQETGEYRLVATSQNPADSFNGSGTIASLTFNATRTGHSDLVLKSDLADHPPPEEVSNPISHTDVGGSVDAVIPEFPATTIIGLLLVLVTIVLMLAKKKCK
jgi:hypothetical protein